MKLTLALALLLAAPAVAQAPADSTADLARFFPEGVTGTFVLLDEQTGVTTRYNPEMAATGYFPASTFKVFNSLVVLDAGAVADEREVLEWDGVDRGSEGWNQSQGLATAFRRSTVWVYQELARRVGPERMRAALEREGYGNAEVGDAVDTFWLVGPLRISADEQVRFLRRLRHGEVGFSEPTVETVRRIMPLEEGDGYAIRHKTGWAWGDGLNHGWWVGWVERDGRTWYFATLLDATGTDFNMWGVREATTRAILRHLGVLPPLAESEPGG